MTKIKRWLLIVVLISLINLSWADLLDMNHNWYIGTCSGNNPNYRRGVFNYSFYGLLDNMRIYNRALSPSEIRFLYREGNP